jgi:hypothetical protein
MPRAILTVCLLPVTCRVTYFLYCIRKFKPYPVQVRIAYLGLLVVGVFPGMQWVHWIQLFGTTAMVTVGYCPLIRRLSLAPLNRHEPLTVSLVWHAFVCEPCAGGLIQWSVNSKNPTVACCSVQLCSRPKAETELWCYTRVSRRCTLDIYSRTLGNIRLNCSNTRYERLPTTFGKSCWHLVLCMPFWTVRFSTGFLFDRDAERILLTGGGLLGGEQVNRAFRCSACGIVTILERS